MEPILYQQNKRKKAGPNQNVCTAPSLRGFTDPSVYVAAELDLVEQNLSRSVRSSERLLTDISSYLIHGGGKRIRPLVTLLAFKVFGGNRVADVVDIATAIELIHTATLLHDDIIDGAEIRRGKESAYKRFGLNATLVTGDFLFIKAFEFAGKFDDTVVQWTADACTSLTEGEILQAFFNRNLQVTVEDYLEIVKRKTASLFQTGAKIAAYLAGTTPSLVNQMGQYGLQLGIAFQMVDDVLDIVGHQELLGKPTGMDLRDGNPSLPIILALNEGQKIVCDAFESKRPKDEVIQKAIEAIGRGTAIHNARNLSKNYAEQAFKAIEKFPLSVYRKGLESLVRLIVERDF